MHCIKCEGKLISSEVAGVTIDQCELCSGVWFDARELDRVLSAGDLSRLARGKHNKAHDEQRASCPRCRGAGKMVRVVSEQRSDVHVDTCTVCYGQWPDGGELRLLSDRGGWMAGALNLFRRMRDKP